MVTVSPEQKFSAAPAVSVLMPTFEQMAFLPRACQSLRAQSFTDWELVIVDDGSSDGTAHAVEALLGDPRISYHRKEVNGGLGAACNTALRLARAPLIAYLPSDDCWFADHLLSLVNCLRGTPGAILAHSGVRSEVRVPGKGVVERLSSDECIEGTTLQLVQVLHRRTDARWMEREELVTDDLERMFWSRLRDLGRFVATGRQTCEWVDHPGQWHKVIQEPLGGINPYRSRYRVGHPLRFGSTVGNHIDEVDHYRIFRERPATPRAADGLTILLVGELAFNSERILALEERGHTLLGLWTPEPHWFNTVGPVPFGHVQDVPLQGWRQAIRRLQPDVIYGLLNWEAVPLAHEVLTSGLDIPFVWHFKESPFDCIANGTWLHLLDLVTMSQAQIYSSPEMRDWFAAADPRIVESGMAMSLDGDLPKAEWFSADRSPPLSAGDGEIHTVIPGAPIGMTSKLVETLGAARIHVHFYGDFHRSAWSSWSDECAAAAPGYFHLHPQVAQPDWVTELSQYDAGWLHQLRSDNEGDLRRAVWGDLNYPARMATYAVAGLPMILPASTGSAMAMQSLLRRLDAGIFYEDVDELVGLLQDRTSLGRRGDAMWRSRHEFMFDSHADSLIRLFRSAMERGVDRR
ncbi:MAG: glycosyltransferase family 2 protein [Candidatus Dormibacteria bacterium]